MNTRQPIITGNKIRLRPKKLGDARDDYRWQTDAELTRLDAAPLLTMSFSQYLLDYTNELHYPLPTRFSFAIETLEGKHIGNCVYYNVDEARGEAELGIMIGDRDYWSKGYGTDAVNTLVEYMFRHTGLRRIYLKTLEWNERAQKCFQKAGFKPFNHISRDGYSFLLMEIFRRDWTKAQTEEKINGK